MGLIMRDGVAYGGNTSIIYRNGIPYVSQGVPNYRIIPKTITMNGTYDPAQDNCDGYSNLTINVPTSDPPVLTTKSITSNGTYNASADNADGYSQVTVNVNQATETKTITANGTYTPSSGKIGFSSVTVNLALGTKSITSNGTYAASSSGYKGFSSVTVNVPQASRVLKWSGNSDSSVSVSLSGYTWVYAVFSNGANVLLQVNGGTNYVGYWGTSPDGVWSQWGASRPVKATTSGVTLDTTKSGIENYTNLLKITAIYGISNLS